MTRTQLRVRLAFAVMALIAILAIGVLLRYGDAPFISARDQSDAYDLVKDLSPLILGILAVFLTSWYQQRMAHLDAVRQLFSRMIDAKSAMALYIAASTRTDDAYTAAYREISRAIDEMRTVYRNVGESAGYIGFYPYEPLHDMRRAFESIRGESTPETRAAAAQQIEAAWAALRWPFLSELGAPEPAEPIIERNAPSARRSGMKPSRRRR